MTTRRSMCLTIGLLGSLLAPTLQAATDPVVLSFAFVGCNRLDKAGVKANQSASTANEAQLLRTFADVAATQPAPQLMILAGDVVRAKKPGTDDLADQLKAWQKLVKKQLPASTRLVAFTGNHELLMDAPDDKDTEIPNPPAYAYWQGQMKPYIAGSDGPAKGGDDHLLDDETSLSYTFRRGNALFVVLNTDSQIDATTVGNVPLAWLAGKLAAAQQDAGVAHVFVMGHKPIAVPGKVPDGGESNIRAAQGAAFYKLLNQGGADGAPTKVRAYLAAHAHQWSYTDSLPATAGPSSVPQIIAGNGGSPPEKSWVSSGNTFGYTLVSVMASGKVTAQNWGRPIPKDYYRQTPAPAAATARGDPLVLKP